jgi:peptidoglycan pentaglycine glycine transferase (the first glycine)
VTALSPERLGPDAAARWAEAEAAFPDVPLVQSWTHGDARSAAGGWTAERLILRDSPGAVRALVQALIRPAPMGLGRLVWIARGPVLDRAVDAAAGFPLWRAAAAALRAHFVTSMGDYLRIAPPFDSDAGAPVPSGFSLTAMDGWASAALDLGAPLDDLHAGLKGKWRTAIRRAEKDGVTVDRAEGAAAVAAFAGAHDAFMAEVGAGGSVDGASIVAMERGVDARLAVYEARLNGAVCGRALTAATPGRGGGRVEYLAGHTDDAGRRANAGQALLWRAVCDAKAAGAATFDVGGLDPERTPKGIFDFKAGLQGTPYRLMPEIDACGGAVARLIKARTDRARAAMGA